MQEKIQKPSHKISGMMGDVFVKFNSYKTVQMIFYDVNT